MSDRYWGHPMNARTWHIFEDGRSLCGGGNWMMTNTSGDKELVSEDDTYREGEDCKACARKSDVLVVSDE